MVKIMRVVFTFDHQEEGTILVGINPELDSLSYPAIVSMIGDRIILKHDDHETIQDVQSVQISTSMANQKNIGISIGKDIAAKDIPIGSVVYSL